MSSYLVNASLTGAWVKVLDKTDTQRFGHLFGTPGDVDINFEGAAPTEFTTIGGTSQIIHLPAYKELWARSAGGVGTSNLKGQMIVIMDLWWQNPFIDASEIIYKGTDLADLLGGGSTKIVDVDVGGLGDFTSIQDAIDSVAAGSMSTIRIAPGTYTENVILKRGVFIRSAGFGFGAAMDVIISSASGDTLRVPHRSSGVIGIMVQSSGPNPTDVGTRVFDDGLGAGGETFFLNFFSASMPGAQAQAVHVDVMPPNENPIFIYAGADADSTAPICVDLEGFLVWFLGGMGGSGAQVGVKIRPGSGLMAGAQVGLNADLATGQVIDADGGFFAGLDCTLDGFNGIKGRNGSTLLLGKVQSFGGIPGTPLDTDVTSPVLMGSAVLSGFGGAPWTNFNVLGPVLRVWEGCEGGGSTGLGGPDQRPTVTGSTVPTGFRFTATDITPGAPGVPGTGGDLVYFQGVGWKDATGAIHP